MRSRVVAAMVMAVLVLAGCAGTDSAADQGGEQAAEEGAAQSADQGAATPDVTAQPSAGGDGASDAAVTVAVASSDLGDILVDGEGATLYVFDDDTGDTSTCYDDCAANWPPLTGTATAGDGVDEGLLGASDRDDGTTQVTYDGHPVYYFAGDQAAGDTNGQAVGGKWWAIGPDGQAIMEATAADTGGSGY